MASVGNVLAGICVVLAFLNLYAWAFMARGDGRNFAVAVFLIAVVSFRLVIKPMVIP